jgi:hypothetical protein
MLAFPHFLAVTALTILVIVAGLSFLIKPGIWQWPVAVGLVLMMQFIQPYAPALADLALSGAFALHALRIPGARLKSALFLGSFGLIQIPILWYNLAVFSSGSNWASFTQQNITLSPPPIYYLWGFAPFWVPAAAGVFWWLRHCLADNEPPATRQMWVADLVISAMITWSLGALLFAYAPTSLQRRFMFSYTLPLAFVATSGLRSVIVPWSKVRAPAWLRSRPMLVPVIMVALACIYAPILALGQSLFVATRPAELFDPLEWGEAADWLQLHAGEDDAVLATEQLSRLIAARTGLPVYSGHPMETLYYAEKSRRVQKYFSGDIGSEWLDDTSVRWVVFTSMDRLTGVVPSYLHLVYERPGVKIFKVMP